MRRVGILSCLSMICLFVVATAPAAWAACHSFEVAADPETVDEGQAVTVTVSRDAAVADSRVQVTAVSGTAQSGTDFSALSQQVNFAGSATEQTLRITIAADRAAEPAENFTIRLSNPSGCAPNQNFRLGDPVSVTIRASSGSAPQPAPPPPPRPAPAPPPPPPPPPAPAPVRTATATPSPTASPSPTPTETEEATPLPTDTPTPLATPASDDGGARPRMIVGILALLGAGGVGYWLYRQRTVPPGI